MLLPATDMKDAVLVAERLRQAIAQIRISHACESGSGFLMFTASIGVSALAENSSNLEVLLRSADASLYQAKRNGRNQVCVSAVANVVDESRSGVN